MSKVTTNKESIDSLFVVTFDKTNTKEYAIKYFFNTFIILVTDDDLLQRNMNYQWLTRKSPYALVFRSPRDNLIKTRIENIAKNKAPLSNVAQYSPSSLGKKKKEKETWKRDGLQCQPFVT